MSFSFLTLFLVATAVMPLVKANRMMVWMCLEFCDETPEQITSNLDEISLHKEILSAVSFEKYTLGPNSTLVDNNLTEVSTNISALGLEAWPLLSSYPHPPEFLDWMREVFADPSTFIEACIEEANVNHYVGYNLDWEPTDDVTSDDGTSYAAFIGTFADALHANGLKLTVDVATWSPIWDYDAIALTNVDSIISMGTYTSSDSSFSSQLDTMVSTFGVARTGVGLETVNASTEERMPVSEVAWRFQQIIQSGAEEVDLWKMPVPTAWWPFIEVYMK